MTKSITANELAQLTEGQLTGNGAITVTAVGALNIAKSHQVSFLGNKKYTNQVAESNAGIIFLPSDYVGTPKENQAFIVCKNPSVAFQKMVDFFAPPAPSYPAGRHASAVIAEGAVVPASCHIAAYVVIEKGVVIGENTIVLPFTFIGENTKIGKDCLLYSNVSIRERSIIGDRCIIQPNAVIGSDGFGFIPNTVTGHIKVPQVGIVELKDDVEIGANVAIDRARFGATLIGKGTKVDNLTQIAHNVEIGEHCFIVSQVGIAGSSTIGNRCTLAGQVGIGGHVHIGDDSTILAQSGVAADVPNKSVLLGSPAIPHRESIRTGLGVLQIGKMRETLKALEKEIADIKAKLGE